MQTPVQSPHVDCIKQFQGRETGSPGKENSVKSEENNLNRNMASFIGSPTLDRDRSLHRSPTSKDKFWDSLRLDYDYLMDDGLIATCREASSDLSYDDEENATIDIWSFTKFIQQFNLLHDMLHRLQSTVAQSENSDEINLVMHGLVTAASSGYLTGSLKPILLPCMKSLHVNLRKDCREKRSSNWFLRI